MNGSPGCSLTLFFLISSFYLSAFEWLFDVGMIRYGMMVFEKQRAVPCLSILRGEGWTDGVSIHSAYHLPIFFSRLYCIRLVCLSAFLHFASLNYMSFLYSIITLL